jgi:cytochrome d ubiquinol oxidase subunit I
MVAIGILIVLIAAFATVLWRRKTLARNRFALWLLVLAAPLSMVAIQTGWAAAEVGRQPWIVWGQLRTVDAISRVVPSGQILTTLVLFAVVYAVLFVAWARVFFGLIGRGPVVERRTPALPADATTDGSTTDAPDTEIPSGR